MARKNRKRHRRLRTFFLFLLTPLSIWLVAFLVWLFWYDIAHLMNPGKASIRTGTNVSRDAAAARNAQPHSGNPSRENIGDEERKRLEDILERR